MSSTQPTKIRRLSVLLAGVLATAVVALPASAARLEQPTPGTYILKDGTTLSVAKNGWMRMFTAEGQRLNMKDGVVMETKDGDSIVMKEDANWKQLRLYGTLRPSR